MQKLILQFDIRDFKYLSNVMRTEIVIDDLDVLAGIKDTSIEINFPDLLKSDELGVTKFINGGRVYFEANLFGYQTHSFT